MRLILFKNSLVYLFALFLVLAFTACTKNFDKYNTNPNAVTKDQLLGDNTYVGNFIRHMQQNVIPIGTSGTGFVNSYQLAQNLCADVYSGYMGASNNWNNGNNNTTYGLQVNWYGEAFRLGFVEIMPSWATIKTAIEQKAPDQYAMAQIIKVEAMHRVTDIYGPLPYFGAGASGLVTRYNPQDSIYYSFFNDLDSAITTLTNFITINPGKKPLSTFDLVYGGDYVQWIKFANSLKLRLAMRIVYANATLAKTKAEEAIKNSYGVMTENSDNAIIRGITGHPLNTISDPNGYHDIRMGANMESFLKGYADPRLNAYFQQGSVPNNAGYHGVRNGISMPDASKYIAFSPLVPFQNVIWMTAAETYFLRAEGILRGWNVGGGSTIQQLYETGIQKSFDQWAVGSTTAYLAKTTLPAAYTDPVSATNNIGSPDPSGRLSTITIKWDNAATDNIKQERIITQKWIAMYPEGQEAWSEFRRTKFPKIFPVVVNNSGGAISTSVQIRRMPFPLSEYQTNAAGVQTGVALLNGADNGGTKLWWDKKP